MKKHPVLWNEILRPDNLENYLCSDEVRNKIQECIDKQDLPFHALFAGRAGSGKTTLAKLIVKNIDCDYLMINATDERSMDVIREKIGAFASASSFKPLKIVILDEATHLLQSSQVLLLNMMETYSLKTRFILTGNYPERLIDPLRSRCTEFDLTPPNKKLIAQHISSFLDEIEIKYELEDLAFIINKFHPDIRRIINNTQKYTINKTLKIDKSKILSDNDYFEKILIELKGLPNWKCWENIRQIITNSGIKSFEETYKYLYNNLEKYSKGNEGLITICLEEYLYKSNFVLDKEINICACMAQIIEILK